MPRIILKGSFKPYTLDKATIQVNNAMDFSPISMNSIIIDVSEDGDVFLATKALEVTQEVYNGIAKGGYLSDHETLVNAMNTIKDVIQSVLRYIKYFYGISELDDRNGKFVVDVKYTWKGVDGIWNSGKERRATKWKPSNPYYLVDDNFISWFPTLEKSNIEPLFGLTHLHKAFLETNTRHQWIDATTAAELGIKEFFGLLKPDIGTLLQYLPSPPLNKLYGAILESYTGVRSPDVKILHEGSETRNALIHQPRSLSPEKDKTDVYLHSVHLALIHLHTILQPESKLFSWLLERTTDQLAILKERIAIEARNKQN